MEVILKIWEWVPWLMGFGAVGWIALAIFAPSILLILTPFLQGAAQGIVEFIKVMYAGIVNILNSWQSTVAVAIIALLAFTYGGEKVKQSQAEQPTMSAPAPSNKYVRKAPSSNSSRVQSVPATPKEEDRSFQLCLPFITCEGR